MKRLKIQWLKWAKYFRGFTIFPTENPSLKKNHLIIERRAYFRRAHDRFICNHKRAFKDITNLAIMDSRITDGPIIN